MKVLVTFAVEAEFAPWRRLRSLRAAAAGGLEIFQAQMGRASVDFVVTGMGKANARRGAEAAMCVPHTVCIAAGFAGSLQESHQLGDVLAARAVQELGKSETIVCSRSLHQAACENQAVDAKMILTVDRVIATAEEKRRLSPLADAVDMESFAVLSAARQKRLPAVALRVVSDRWDEDVPAEIGTTVDERGRVKLGGVVKYVAAHPLRLPALIRLGRQSHIAAEALAHFLEAFIKELSLREHGWPPQELQEAAR